MFDLIVIRVLDNDFDESACCSIASSCINLRSLQYIILDETPAACIRSGHWQRAGLVKPPDEVVSQGWEPVIEYLQAGPYVAVHELRLMLIGDGEVGKTSLFKAFTSLDGRAARIRKEDRTVGIDLSELVLAADGGPEMRDRRFTTCRTRCSSRGAACTCSCGRRTSSPRAIQRKRSQSTILWRHSSGGCSFWLPTCLKPALLLWARTAESTAARLNPCESVWMRR